MEDADRLANLPVLLVYWFLLLVAVAFAAGALWQVNKVRGERTVELRVVDRTVRVDVRELRGKRGPYKVLWAEAALTLERLDDRRVVRHTSGRSIAKDELIAMTFLDAWEPGAKVTGVERAGVLEVEGVSSWGAAGGLAMGFWMFGTFAWMARPFALGEPGPSMGMRFLVMALIPISVGAWGVRDYLQRQKDVPREAVEGRGVEDPAEKLWADLEARRVKVEEGGRAFVDLEKARYCRYEWAGKELRSTSLWCQPGEGETVPGRLNPANPRDVKWGAEP